MESRKDYESREILGHLKRIRQIETEPLRDRQEGARELQDALTNWFNNPEDDYLVDRVFGWAYNGSFGAGIYYRFRNAKSIKPRTKAIWLFTEACILNFQTDSRHVCQAVKKALPKDAQDWLNTLLIAEMARQDKDSE
jgi:hypothetical protein